MTTPRMTQRVARGLFAATGHRAGIVLAALVVALGIGVGTWGVVAQNKTTPATAGAATTAPTSPPVSICGNASELTGPSTAPSGAVTIPAGSDTGSYNTPNTVYYLAAGTHTVGTGEYNQIIPGNNDTYIGAPGAILSGQTDNNYAFTGSATGVTIEYLTVEDFGVYTSDSSDSQEMVVNNGTSSGWTITHDTIENNGGAGAGVGTNGVLSYSCLENNGQYGFQTYNPNGTSNATIEDNEFYDNDEGGYDLHTGCGCAAASGKFWTTNGAYFENNYVHTDSETDSTFTGDPCVWADTDNSGVTITGNYLEGCNAEGIDVEASYFNTISDNTIVNAGGGYVANSNISGFPIGAIYVSESGYDSRAPAETGGAGMIIGNVLTNDAGGIILWENSNRHCNDGSDGVCTLVDSAATLSSCPNNSTAASSATLYWDCRWRTQNVQVSGNTESLTIADVPNCTQSGSEMCGYNGVFSEYASYTPYTVAPSPNECDNEGTVGSCPTPIPNNPWAIPVSISNDQHNVFSDNDYCGPWLFDPMQQGVSVSFAQWQKGYANPNGANATSTPQDAGSTDNSTCGTTTTTTNPTTTTTSQPTTTTTSPTTTTTMPTTTTTQPPTYTGPVIDQSAGAVGASKVTTAAVSTGPQELVIAVVSGRGPINQTFTVTGGGLTFNLDHTNVTGNEYTETFTAETVSALTNVAFTATASSSGADLRLEIVTANAQVVQ